MGAANKTTRLGSQRKATVGTRDKPGMNDLTQNYVKHAYDEL